MGAASVVDLSGNMLECSDSPEAMTDLISGGVLRYLSIARNNFRCALKFPEYTELLSLDLSNNQFSGTLPTFSGGYLGSLFLNNNLFYGSALPSLTIAILDVSHNIISGSIDFSLLPNLASFKATGNSIRWVTGLSPLKGLQTLSLAHNDLREFPGLDTLGHLVEMNTLQYIDVSLKPLIPKLSPAEMARAGIVKTSSISAFENLIGAVCSQMTFKGAQYPVTFHYDEGLFDHAQCYCNSSYFGSPKACFKCPEEGEGSCGASSLEIQANWFAFNASENGNGIENILIEAESCTVTPEQQLTKKSNCDGIRLVSSTELSLNASIISKMLPTQCLTGSDGRLCS